MTKIRIKKFKTINQKLKVMFSQSQYKYQNVAIDKIIH